MSLVLDPSLNKLLVSMRMNLYQSVPDVEWVSIDRRTFAGIIISLDVSLGSCILSAMAYYVNEWRMLILAVTSPLLLSVVAWRYQTFSKSCTRTSYQSPLEWYTKFCFCLAPGGCQSLHGGSQPMGEQKPPIST